jgi:hypothetical protein
MTVAGATDALMETVVIPSKPTVAAGTGLIIGVGWTEIGAVGVTGGSVDRFFSFSADTSFKSSSISSSGKTSS